MQTITWHKTCSSLGPGPGCHGAWEPPANTAYCAYWGTAAESPWWQRAGKLKLEVEEWTRWLLCAGWVALGPDVWGHLNSGVTTVSVTSVTRDTVWHRVTSGVISSRLTQTLINQQPATAAGQLSIFPSVCSALVRSFCIDCKFLSAIINKN